MRPWHRLKHWEKTIEQSPKSKLYQTLLIYFGISLLVGVLVGSVLQWVKIQNFKAQVSELKQKEYQQLNQLVEKSKSVNMSSSDNY